MVIDLSNPLWFIVGVFAAAVVLIGIAYYIKGILVEAQVEAARRIRAEEEEAKRKDIGRKSRP
jgi:high-affinity Fe2+/Pb2+ permease